MDLKREKEKTKKKRRHIDKDPDFYIDFDKADNKTMFEFNAGGGFKFLLGDTGDLILRIEWRWHQIVGSTAGLKNSMYRQELSMGLAWHF